MDYNLTEKVFRKEYVPIIVLNFLVKPKKIYFFVGFLGIIYFNLIKIKIS